MLLPALLDGNLFVGVRYVVRPAIALSKSYYLDLIYGILQPGKDSHIQPEKYTPENAEKILRPGYIHGAAKWSKGIGETKITPGLFGELAFVMEPDKPKAFVKALTFGGNAAIYTHPLSIMANRKAYRYQLSLFVELAIGGRISCCN